MEALVGRNHIIGLEDSFTKAIHPIFAMLLSFVDGRDMHECSADAAKALNVPTAKIENFFCSLLDKSENVFIKSKDGISSFPPFTIISQPTGSQVRRYSPALFEYTKVDMQAKRHYTPSSITLMVNNVCLTDCIYCYQDKSRRTDCTIPLNRIKQLIHEAKDLHVNTFDVVGGEFFLYKYWKEVLSELRKCGFNPYLSTKMPLTEQDIQFLADLGVCDIQISLDTMIEQHLIDSIKVKKGYCEQMKQTLSSLDNYGIPVMAHTVLTRHNDSIEDMESLYKTLKELKHLKDWHIVKGEDTLYPKTQYENIEIGVVEYNQIIDYLQQVKNQTGLSIHIPNKAIEAENATELSNRKRKDFFRRAYCSGLFSSLYILPDGKVTICEQLYWNNRFLVGDVLQESIMEVWNSEKSLALFNLKQEEIPKDSLCSSCAQYAECRTLRQVCYREIIKRHGASKWYYPDVNCPYTKTV